MPSQVEFLAREIARKAGYDPDKLVVPVDRDHDYDYLSLGFAPVDLKKLIPVFTLFYDDARRQLQEHEKGDNQRVRGEAAFA